MGTPETAPFTEQYEILHDELGLSCSELIVLGTGPEKPVLLPDELTKEQAEQWKLFKESDTRYSLQEPNFYVVEGGAYLSVLEDIKNSGEPPEIIAQMLLEKRQQWQDNPRFTCNRWERLNVLSAGVLMLSGNIKKVIFSGGTSNIPIRLDEHGEEDPVSRALHDGQKSEGELMLSLFVSTFGRRLFQKDHPVRELLKGYLEVQQFMPDLTYKDYREALYNEYIAHELPQKAKAETHSVNTLQNFSLSMNEHPDIINAGIICANFQVQRAIVLAELFRLPLSEKPGIDAEYSLLKRAELRNKQAYKRMMEYMGNPYENEDLMKRVLADERWIQAHTLPEYAIGFNIGYIFDLNDLSRVQMILDDMNRPGWIEYARKVFGEAGLKFEEISLLDLVDVGKRYPEKIAAIKKALSIFKKEVSGSTGPREGYVPPAVADLPKERMTFLLPHHEQTVSG